PVRDHEIDGLGSDVIGGQHQIALVFAIFFIDQNDHAARAQLGDDFGDGRNAVAFGIVELHRRNVTHDFTLEKSSLILAPGRSAFWYCRLNAYELQRCPLRVRTSARSMVQDVGAALLWRAWRAGTDAWKGN